MVAPETLSRQQVLDAVLDSMKHPVYTDAKSKAAAAKGKGGTALLHAGVFQEAHKAGEDGVVHQHVHIIIRAATAFRFGPVKTALLRRHGLAVHFGCTHAGYFSAVRYVHLPSKNKPRKSLDAKPLLWAASGTHPDLDECCHEPLTSAGIRAQMLKKMHKAAEKGKLEKVTELDVWPLVVQNNFRNGPDFELAHQDLRQVVPGVGTAAGYP